MAKYILRKTCAEQGCKESARFEYDTRADSIEGGKSNRNWRCSRHYESESVLSKEAPVREHVMLSQRGSLDRLYWNGGSGFAFGPGFKAWADDFPEGSRLIVTARIELPPAAASGQAAVQEVQPVAWMHEFTDPHDGQRRCEPRRNRPADYELLPGDTVRPLVYAAASQPSAQTDDALEVLRKAEEFAKEVATRRAVRLYADDLEKAARELLAAITQATTKEGA